MRMAMPVCGCSQIPGKCLATISFAPSSALSSFSVDSVDSAIGHLLICRSCFPSEVAESLSSSKGRHNAHSVPIREPYLKPAIAAQKPHIQRDKEGELDLPCLGIDEGLAEACAMSVDQPADACLAGLQGLADGTDFVQQFGHGLAGCGRCGNPL